MDIFKQIRRQVMANNLRTSIRLFEVNPSEITRNALKKDVELVKEEMELIRQEQLLAQAETITQAIL